MSPPQLPRNAPILQILHPSVPSIGLFLRMNDHFSIFDDVDHFVGNFTALDIPLWFDEGLDDIMGP